MKLLQKACDHMSDDGKIGSCCVAAEDTSWDSRDLLRILELYHREIDTMFTILLKWSVDSFILQIRRPTHTSPNLTKFAIYRAQLVERRLDDSEIKHLTDPMEGKSTFEDFQVGEEAV